MTHPFKLKANTLGKFAIYELLLNEFFEKNPNVRESELHVAYLDFSKKYGLTVSSKLKRNTDFLLIGGRDE